MVYPSIRSYVVIQFCNNLIMSFEQDDKLCKQDIKSFEQHIKSSEQAKNKTRMSLPGFRKYLSFSTFLRYQNSKSIYPPYVQDLH